MKWSLGEAKTKLSTVVALTTTEGAQVITRFGTPTAVVVSYDEYQRLTETTSFKDFLLSGNLPDLPISRPNVVARDIAW